MKHAFTVINKFFTPEELNAIEQLGDAMAQEKAVVAVKSDNDDKTRITDVAWMFYEPRTVPLYKRITQLVQKLNTEVYQFDVNALETLQYTVYHGAEGGHYAWHTDLGPHNPKPRKISISIQLTDPSHYEGCDLQFRAGPTVGHAPRDRGAVIAFPSFFLHRVTPITSGTRKSLVVWATGPDFR
jgi:PKHD-type hydroxylase